MNDPQNRVRCVWAETGVEVWRDLDYVQRPIGAGEEDRREIRMPKLFDGEEAHWSLGDPRPHITRVQRTADTRYNEHGDVMRSVRSDYSNSSEEFGSQEHSCVMDAILGRGNY